jgi:hypothetical protein
MIKTIALALIALTSIPACTPQEEQQVVSAIQPTGACIADIVMLTQGTEDIAAILSVCPVAINDIYQVVSELLAREPVDAGTALTPDLRAHLTRIQTKAKVLLPDAGQ